MKAQVITLALIVLILSVGHVVEGQFFRGGGGGGRRGFFGGRGGGRGGRGRGRGRGRGFGLIRGGRRALAFVGALALLGAFAGKKKRSADDIFGDEMEYVSPEEQALKYFDLAMELDDDTCLEKTLCSIMASSKAQKKPSTLVKILETIYNGNMPLLGVEGHKEATKLLEAGLLGKTAKTEEVCKTVFKTCKVDSGVLKKQLESEYEEDSE